MDCVEKDSCTGAANPSQPPAHVLRSLPLLVFEHEPAQARKNETTTTTAAPDHDDDDADHPEELMFSLSEQSIYKAEKPAILSTKDKICFTTPQGWILIAHDAPPWDAWLWQPLTGDTLALPPIPEDLYIPDNSRCLLTHDSAAHPDCAVVLLDVGDPDGDPGYGPYMWFCRINGGNSRRWVEHRYDIGEYTSPLDPTIVRKFHIPAIAALGGQLHFVFTQSNKIKMGVVDLNFDHPPSADLRTLEEIDATISVPEGMPSGAAWLLESQGELFHVCVCFRELRFADVGAVLVHKMDFVGGHWCRVHDIGDRVFLLPHEGNASWCCASACGLEGNRVCFMKNFVEDDGELCVYHLEDQKMEIVPAHEQDLVLVRTKPYWIVPPCGQDQD